MNIIFVYGTLLKGMERFNVLSNSQFIDHGYTEAILYDLGEYPAITKGNKTVYGELYKIDDEILNVLDRIEGYFPDDLDQSLYIRKEVDVTLFKDGSQTKTLTYFYNQPITTNESISYGDYRRYIAEENYDKQWYIAYGSNISSKRLMQRIGQPDEIKTGYLEGYKLMFNKRANRGGVYANVAYWGSEYRCPFAAYRISLEQLKILDKCEGEPSHYVRVGIPFSDRSDNFSQIGHIYIAHPNYLKKNSEPSSDYLKYIIDGYEEHGFDTNSLPEL